ncbi:MAG: hypothetical protein ACXVQR_03145 [Solirubrobacteraceae bacterium]
MADYLRFRVTAAKAGVSMALLALIGGLAARGESAPATVNATPAASTGLFLKLGGITGNARTSFLKLEQKVRGIDETLASLEHKLARSYYTEQTVNSTFLKIKDAGAQYLKIRSADTSFLKIDDAAKIYLTSSDAAAKFLKLDGTAANANALGGQAPSAFFQGRGNVVSGATSLASGANPNPATVLRDSHGIIAVLLSGNADQTQFQITNNSSVPLEAITDGSTAPLTLAPGVPALLPAVQHQNAGEFTVQIMPSGAFNQVVTLVLGVTPAFADGSVKASGQMLIGLL